MNAAIVQPVALSLGRLRLRIVDETTDGTGAVNIHSVSVVLKFCVARLVSVSVVPELLTAGLASTEPLTATYRTRNELAVGVNVDDGYDAAFDVLAEVGPATTDTATAYPAVKRRRLPG